MSNTDTVFISKVIESNRVTIPKHIVEILDLHKGDYIEVRIVRVVKRRQEVEV